MNRRTRVSRFLGTPRLLAKMIVTPAKAGVQARGKLDSRFHGNDGPGRVVASLFFIAVGLYGCNSEVLQKQAEQIKEQEAQIARQRKEINELVAGQQQADQKRLDCNRAFRDYFEKAQAAGDREQAISLYREGLRLCPDDDVAHYELGKTLADQGRYLEAEKEFEAALKFNPDFIDARKQLDTVRKNR